MTPAIAIVLAELLCEGAAISWYWQGFENTAALGEWKLMITTMCLADYTNTCGIISMRKPVPHGRAKVRFSLPLVTRSTILINGSATPYADVIAPFRLLQANFSIQDDQDQKLEPLKEMNKMGLTTHREWRLNQAVTSLLYRMWQKVPTWQSGDHLGRFEKPDCNVDQRCDHCPYQTLLCSYVPSIKIARRQLLGTSALA